MIQRIQSLYLLIAAALMGVLYVLPIMSFDLNGWVNVYVCHVSGASVNTLSMVPLAFLPLLSILLSVLAFLSFKNRSMQMKLGKFNLLTLVVSAVVIGIYFVRFGQLHQVTVKPEFSISLILVAIILVFMANKAIKKDDDLVKSADRIR